MSKPIEVDNPATGEIYARCNRLSEAAVMDRAEGAARCQRDWANVAAPERALLIERFCESMLKAKEAIARDLTGQMGKPLSQARGEVEGCVARAQHMAQIAEAALAPQTLAERPGTLRRITRVPHGVVLCIAPWNYPLLTAVNVVVPAVLAGNTVLLKHSSRTPLCGEHFEKAFREAGAPDGLVTAIPASHSAVEALIADGRVHCVGLTGSVSAGRKIYRAAADRLLPCGLELGGKDPAYIAADADLDRAADGVADGALYNAGQSCCAVERIYVHERVYDAVLDRLRSLVRAHAPGDPLAEATRLGPLALPSAPAEQAAQVKDAVDRGASLLEGGHAASVTGRGRYFAATLLAECSQEMTVIREESFGPLVPVVKVSSDEEALKLMNDSRFGLTASIWTKDPERALSLGNRLETGTVFMNRCDALDPALPWTGVKESGLGCTLSEVGLHQLTRPRSYNFNLE